jgi:hypothetical protein
MGAGVYAAATARLGVVAALVTVGTSHEGHEAEGAAKLVNPPPPKVPATYADPFQVYGTTTEVRASKMLTFVFP